MPLRLVIVLVQFIISITIFVIVGVLAYRSPITFSDVMHDPLKASIIVITATICGALFAAGIAAFRRALRSSSN